MKFKLGLLMDYTAEHTTTAQVPWVYISPTGRITRQGRFLKARLEDHSFDKHDKLYSSIFCLQPNR